MKKLSGKVAFVTGGSRGIGAAISKRLAQEGATVIFTHSGKDEKNATDVLDAIRLNGVKASAVVARNEDTASIVDALVAAREEYGSLDILVNNAGVFLHKSIEEYTLDEFDEVMNINVKAVFVASQFAARYMQNGGRIITIGSNMADRVASSGGSLYAMSKSALIGLTKGIARDLGPHGITVNLIQPGPIDTDMNPADSEFAPVIKTFMAIDRYGTTQEIAGMVAYLAGEESQFVTGASLTIDGGYSI